jgi:two-component system, cell cycle sensor histidine kinase and response regulator CckA
MREEIITENIPDKATGIARLEEEKKVLADQVKRLIRAETRLYEYQQELDAQLREYQKLYELNRKFAGNFDIQSIFEHALEYVIQYLEYERVVFFRQPEGTGLFSVCAVDGYYDETEKKTIAGLTIREDEGFLSPLYAGGEYLICMSDTEEEGLVTYRSRLLMYEYMVYPLGARGRPSALLAVGNSAGNAVLYRKVDMQKRALLGMGNLVGLLSSTVENYISYTNMKKALDQEKLAEVRYRSIFENASEGIFQISAEGRFISCNPAGAAILGYETPEELIESVTDVEHQLWADPKTQSELRDIILSGKDVKNFEVEFYRKDKTRQWALMSLKPSFNEEHKMTHMDGITLDISERKRAEEALRRSQEMLTNVLDNFPGVVFWKNLSSAYLGCNRNFSLGAGLADPSEIVDKTDYDLPWTRTEGEAYRADDRAVIMSGKPRLNIVETQLQANGQTLWFDTNKVPLFDPDGNVIGVLGASNDITERKRAEEALKAAQEELVRKEKLSILGQLAGIVGHEIRNPLGVMNNAVYFLKTIMPDASDTVKEYLDIIKQEIGNSQRIITDLLDFSRTKTPQIVPVEVNALITGTLGKCYIPENINVKTDILDTLPQVHVDPFQMGQVLENLITNAIQAMPEGGKLTLAAREVTGHRSQVTGTDVNPETCGLLPGTDTDFIEISVEDSGSGISEENMKNLFQPLFTTKTKGIGLGLVVCKNLVEANGGRIEVESHPGKGTTFVIKLGTAPGGGER